MKRRPIFFAIAPLLVVGAALWGVNYRLDHPPLTQADEEFRALVAGADSIEASQMSCQASVCFRNFLIKYKPLNSAQTREFIEQLRFINSPANIGAPSSEHFTQLYLEFRRKGKQPSTFFVLQHSAHSSQLAQFTSSTSYYLNPRFNKRLNRALDAYLPQRIRP